MHQAFPIHLDQQCWRSESVGSFSGHAMPASVAARDCPHDLWPVAAYA